MFLSLGSFRKCTPYNQKVYTTRECTVYTGETLYLCNHKYNPRRCLFELSNAAFIELIGLLGGAIVRPAAANIKRRKAIGRGGNMPPAAYLIIVAWFSPKSVVPCLRILQLVKMLAAKTVLNQNKTKLYNKK